MKLSIAGIRCIRIVYAIERISSSIENSTRSKIFKIKNFLFVRPNRKISTFTSPPSSLPQFHHITNLFHIHIHIPTKLHQRHIYCIISFLESHQTEKLTSSSHTKFRFIRAVILYTINSDRKNKRLSTTAPFHTFANHTIAPPHTCTLIA